MPNQFDRTIQAVQNANQQQKAEAFIDGVTQQMQQQSGQTAQELSKDLQAAKTQLVKAFNQQQGG